MQKVKGDKKDLFFFLLFTPLLPVCCEYFKPAKVQKANKFPDEKPKEKKKLFPGPGNKRAKSGKQVTAQYTKQSFFSNFSSSNVSVESASHTGLSVWRKCCHMKGACKEHGEGLFVRA